MSETRNELQVGTTYFLEAAKGYHLGLNGSAQGWVHDLRLKGLEEFEAQGLPTSKLEGWRYTSLKSVGLTKLKEVGPSDLSSVDLDNVGIPSVDATRVVLNNGVFDEGASNLEGIPQGVLVTSLADAFLNHRDLVERNLAQHVDIQSEAFAALNTAFLEGGVFVYVPKGVVVEKPIHLVTINTDGGVSHPRCLVVLEPSSQAVVYESYCGNNEDEYLNNVVTEFHLGANAHLKNIRFQAESIRSYHFATILVRQERSSSFNSHLVSLGGGIARTHIEATVLGEGADCQLRGLYCVDGRRHADVHILMDHAKPHCTSHQHFKGVVGDKGTSVFDGKVLVREDAQKTDAIQRNNNLLLSRNAQANTRPQLEIYADDVKCGHGATVGQLDENQIFYLRSRGLDLESARRELTYAFANEVLNTIKDASARDFLESAVRKRLQE